MDIIIRNMDSQLFLGGTEPTTLKDYLSFWEKKPSTCITSARAGVTILLTS